MLKLTNNPVKNILKILVTKSSFQIVTPCSFHFEFFVSFDKTKKITTASSQDFSFTNVPNF